MAATGQVTVALSFTPTGGIIQTVAPGAKSITLSQDLYCQNVMSVPTSKTALVLGSVSGSDLGYCLLVNLDANNYVSLFSDNSSATELARIGPGMPALIPFGPSATPFLQANTSACKVQYFLISA